jgi:leucine dehydrogenase
MSAFLWKTKRGQAAGGIRLKEYNEVGHFIKDGLRLAIDMGRKSSLAGLWWGGGKGVIPVPDSVPQPKRRQLFKDYGDFITSLRGCFVAAEDSGITVSDMDMVFRRTRFTTCISPQLGGSGSPSNPTAMGVRAAMEGALFQLDGSTLEGKTVAVQGLGRVGSALVQHLLTAGVKRVIASDIDPRRVADIEKLYEV